MKIAYLSENLSIHDYRFLKKLIETENEIYLFAIKNEIPDNIRNLSRLKIFQPSSASIRNPRFSVIRRFFSNFLLLFELRKLFNKLQPDIIHAGWVPGSGFFVALLGAHPFLLMPWGSDVLVYPRKTWLNKQRIIFTLKRADAITCDCEEVKKSIIDLANYPAKKITVFPWGIDLNLFKPEYQKEALKIKADLGWSNKKILIMDRSFEPVYGIDVFLRSLPEVFKNQPDTGVLLIGQGFLEDKLRKLTSDLDINDKVKFVGSVSNKSLPAYLCAADFYVSSSYSDGSSLSLMEAMACAKAVIVSDVPANLEWVVHGENGFIFPRGDEKELSKQLLRLLKNKNKSELFGQRNLAIAKERADWNKNFKVLLKIYEELREGSRK